VVVSGHFVDRDGERAYTLQSGLEERLAGPLDPVLFEMLTIVALRLAVREGLQQFSVGFNVSEQATEKTNRGPHARVAPRLKATDSALAEVPSTHTVSPLRAENWPTRSEAVRSE